MPLDGEYEPSTSEWARDQAERYEATDGREANDLRGTARHHPDQRRREDRQAAQDGAHARRARGRLRGRRVPRRGAAASGLVLEPEGTSARRAAGPRREARLPGARGRAATRRRSGGSGRWRRGRPMPTTRRRPIARSRCSCSSGCRRRRALRPVFRKPHCGSRGSCGKSHLPQQHRRHAWSAPLRSTRSARARVGSTFCSRLGPLISFQIERAFAIASGSLSAA